MKKVFVVLLIGMTFCVSNAFAGFLADFEIYNPTTMSFETGFEFDWSSSGSGVAVGLADPADIVVDTEFQFYYQAAMTGLLDSNGQRVTAFDSGLNTDFEYTLVSSLTEKITSVNIVGNLAIATFAVVEGTWAIYESDYNHVVLTGTGFDDGTQVATGSILPGQTTTFTLDLGTGVGSGSFSFDGLVNSDYDRNFLRSLNESGGIYIDDFHIPVAGISVPPGNSLTTAFFIGGDGTMYPDYNVTGDDLLFKVDTNNNLSVVPEPSTYLLLGMGLLGLFVCRRRSKS